MVDIGTDHALLPIHLLRSGRCPRVTGVEKADGPLRAAEQAVAQAGLADVCPVRAGDGFSPVAPGEADTAVIAGMGGQTMAGVLDGAPAGVLDGMDRLVLQPMNRAAAMRKWLYGHGWHVAEEGLVQEAGRLYEVVVAEHGFAAMPEAVLLEVGPLLWVGRHPLLRRHLEGLIAKYSKVLEGLAHSRSIEAQAMRVRVGVKLERLKGMIECL